MRTLVALFLLCLLGACDEDAGPVGNSPNHAPIFDDQPDTTIAYGDTLHLTASAYDPEGDSFTFSVAVIATLSEIRSGYFAAVGMDAHTGAFWFYPGTRDIPSRSFRFSAEDELGHASTMTFKVSVSTPVSSTRPLP
jgi:hypothetical protein